EFEEGERHAGAVVNRAQPLDVVEHPCCGNFGARDSRPLRKVHQMRLGVQPGAKAGRTEAAVEHRGDRALALGAGDMDGAQAAMRIADEVEGSFHPLELVNLAARLERVEPVDSFGELVHSQPGVYRLMIDSERIRAETE